MPYQFNDLTSYTPTKEDEVRFWNKVAITANSDKCWIWKHATDKRNYGSFRINNRTHTATRVAYLLHNKELPELMICHKCDNPLCCNPRHLFAATQKENIRDMIDKGRHSHGDSHRALMKPKRGSQHGMAKLTEEQVAEIKKLYATKPSRRTGILQEDLAKMFNVSRAAISSIIRNRKWRHL